MKSFILTICTLMGLPTVSAKDSSEIVNKERNEILKRERKNEFIYDWSAMGSGCRGRLLESKGNVSLSSKPLGPPFLNRYQLRLVLEKFRLESPVPADQGKTNLEFARDCAIRIALNPPAGKKIADVGVSSMYYLTKNEQSELKTMGKLTLGMATLGESRVDFSKREAFATMYRDLHLSAGRSHSALNEVKCGQAKLLGIDLILYVDRDSEAAKVNMSLENNVLDVVVDLDACT